MSSERRSSSPDLSKTPRTEVVVGDGGATAGNTNSNPVSVPRPSPSATGLASTPALNLLQIQQEQQQQQRDNSRIEIVSRESQLFDSFLDGLNATNGDELVLGTSPNGANTRGANSLSVSPNLKRPPPVPTPTSAATASSSKTPTLVSPNLTASILAAASAGQSQYSSPYFDYHMDKSIQHEDYRQFAQQCVFYPQQAQASSKDRITQIQRTASVELADEFRAIYEGFRQCIKLRQKYIRLSFQRNGDNPKDLENTYQPYPVPRSIGGRVTNAFNYSMIGLSVSPGDQEPSNATEVKPLIINMDLIPAKDNLLFQLNNEGVFQVYTDQDAQEADRPAFEVPSIKNYFQDLEFILNVVSDGPNKSFAYRRLRFLENKYQLYSLLNEHQEMADTKRVPHRDFYNVRKVDTHVHHSSCMNQKHLLRFIKGKLKRKPNVCPALKYLTLQQVFESLNLTAYDLSIDTLDMHAHRDSFHRFDKFNLKYNPIGESRLREVFLKTDNMIKGKYLADLTREVIADLEASKYQMAEYRLSVYGRSPKEWDKLASWVCDNSLFSDNVRWLIQVPRLYSVYKSTNTIENFEEMINNIFRPLFEVTQDPKSHPQLHIFLQRVVGFDSVDDESKSERRIHKKYPIPRLWNIHLNPPYAYYLYYMYANICSLNQWRKRRGFNTFALRPHAGEAGDTDNLAASFLTSQCISHGIMLRKVPALQYLYYLEQVGLAMSPLSNNALFINYERNPFPTFFRLGMNVSLSTDDPLQFHYTKEPLIEEYSVAAQIWKFSAVDMCELARNSVLQSGWEMSVKKKWLGERCFLPGPAGNDIHKTNLPDLRLQYRYQTLLEERNMVLHFDEPEVYSYPGWPYVIPVLSTVNDEVNGRTIVMTKVPSLSSQSSNASLASKSESPQAALRRPAAAPVHHNHHPSGQQPYQKTKLAHGFSQADFAEKDASTETLPYALHGGTERDSVSLDPLAMKAGHSNEDTSKKDGDQGEQSLHEIGANLAELEAEAFTQEEQIVRLSQSLNDLAMGGKAGDMEFETDDKYHQPRAMSEPDTEPSELYASMDRETIQSVSKMMSGKPTTSVAASVASVASGISGATSGGTGSMGMPLLSQQQMKMVPGVLTASAQRRRTKSAEEGLSADAAAASASVTRTKEKNKLRMTQM